MVVDDVGILFRSVVPEQHCSVDLAVELHGNLLVAFANGCRFELRDTLLKISAAIATKIRGLGRSWENGDSSDRAETRDREKAGPLEGAESKGDRAGR